MLEQICYYNFYEQVTEALHSVIGIVYSIKIQVGTGIMQK